MSSAEIIVLLCVLCLVPLWAAGSIIMFALGTVRCGRLIDPYYDAGGGDDERGRCPVGPHGPRADGGVKQPQDARPGPHEADWWPEFEREWGRYVEEQESCPTGRDQAATEPGDEASGIPTRA